LRRESVDDLLLDDAYSRGKPILGICYGLQSLNVFRAGSLIQHIPDFLPDETRGKINHEAGKKVALAHTVEIDADSLLAEILCRDSRPRLSDRAQPGGSAAQELEARRAHIIDGHENRSAHVAHEHENREGHGFSRADKSNEENRASAPEGDSLVIPVNSSHHQSADAIGRGLRIVARCPDDNIIEAIEGTDPNHFVVAVQWHPERAVDQDEPSRAIFRALIEAARK
jgi:putative glutamine amidotransferase